MNVMRKNADWKARRRARGLEPLFMKDYDPDQPRDENGRWIDTGAVDRPALIAKRKALMEEMRPLAEKGTMSGSEARRFMELGNEISGVMFDLVTTKPFTGDKIKTEAERMSTLPKDIVMTAHADVFGNRDVFMALSNAAFGTQNAAETEVDKLYRTNPGKLYNRFNATREALRSKFGNTMKLYRAEGKQMDKPTKNWATTRAYAAQFGSKIIERDVPIDEIIAVNVDPVGNYHEMIVGKRPITKDYDPDQPRDEHGRWTEGLGYREDQRKDSTFARFREEAFKYDEKGLRGDSTATIGYRIPITIPVSLVANVPGRQGEKRVPGDWQYDTLIKDVNKRGFTDETPIMVFVNPKGEPYINEGNTRVAIAKLKGVERISAWIDWKNGAHQVEGPWNPDKIVPLAKPKITNDYSPEQPRDDHGRWTETGDLITYHGTIQRFLDAIKEQGILARPGHRNFDRAKYRGERSQSVYVAKEFEDASFFASEAVQAQKNRLYKKYKSHMQYMNMASDKELDGLTPVVLEVHMPKDAADRLQFDKSAGGQAVYLRGDIPPEWIKKAYTGSMFKAWNPDPKDWKEHHIRDAASDDVFYVVVFVDTKNQINDAASADPSGTEPLQRMFKKDMRRRWQDVRRAIRAGLETYDFTGVGDRVMPFQNWIEQVMASRVLGTGAWMKAYLTKAQDLAETRARGLTVDGLTLDADLDFMKLLQDNAVAELRGIMAAVAQQTTRALGNGIIARKNPTNDILKLITKIGEGRSNMLISHAVMKVFSVATLEAFRAAGHTQVGIIPEKVPHVHIGDAARKTPQPRGKGGKFRKFAKPMSRANQRKAENQYLEMRELGTVNVMTAEDDRVCDTCENIADDGPYGIDQALSLIPAHINCRCVFIPTGRLPMEDYDPEQPRDERGRWSNTGAAPITGKMGKSEPAFGGMTKEDYLHTLEIMSHKLEGDEDLTDFLQKQVETPTITQPGVAKLLLDHGKYYEADENTFSGPRGEPKMCYMNAGRAVIDDPSNTYVEGYVDVDGVPIAHAWYLDKDGRVVDPTIRGVNATNYFGIPFNSNYLMLSIMKNKYWGLLGEQSKKTLPALVSGREKSFVRDSLSDFTLYQNPLSPEDEAWIASKLQVRDYDPDQPRDERGRWTDGGFRNTDDVSGTFLVARLQRSGDTSVRGKNAGNLPGLWSHLENLDQRFEFAGGSGDAVGIYRITAPKQDAGSYSASLVGKRDESNAIGVRNRPWTARERVGANTASISYSFGQKAEFKEELLREVPLAEIRSKLKEKYPKSYGDFGMLDDPIDDVDFLHSMLSEKRMPVEDYDPDQPRAPKGTETGGQWVSSIEAEGNEPAGGGETPKYHQPDQRVFDVGGDAWNKKLATQLELEYVAAKPALEEIEKNAVGQSVYGNFTAPDWDGIKPALQQKVENLWKISAHGDTLKQEIDNYWESDAVELDAKYHVLDAIGDSTNSDFFSDVMETLREDEPDKTYPFTDEQLKNALLLELDDDENLKVSFKDDFLNHAGEHLVDPKQMNLPGIDAQKPADFLTKEMRLELSTMVKAKFEENVKEAIKYQSFDPPSWVEQSVEEILSDTWEQMDDQSKYEIADKLGAIESDNSQSDSIDALPDRYDPTQEIPDEDYTRTQKLANYMSVKRGQDLIKERLGKDVDLKNVATIDNALWRAWVESSTSDLGIILQTAIADEFQGRYNSKHFERKISMRGGDQPIDGVKRMANERYGDNGYEEIKALVRAKWETTQWLLEKADKPMVNLYRGLSTDLTGQREEKVTINHPKLGEGTFTKLPDVSVLRNGAASTTHDIGIANGWKVSDPNKITLRAVVPRTAIISVPAYGVNVHKERESVLMGTAWVGWDAWRGDAPTLEDYPLVRENP